jgi:predicted MFS family arabinose efflux permease
MLVGAIMDGFSLSAREAGLAGSVELGAIAVVSLLIAPRVSSLSRSSLALVGVAVTIVGYSLSAVAPSYGPLVVARLVAGLGEGAILAAGNAAAASALDPDRLWAFVVIFGGAVAALLIGGIPYAIGPWGHVGGFGMIGVVCLVCTPLLKLLPRAPDGAARARASRLPHLRLGVATLVALLLIEIGESGLWAFSERLGLAVDLSAEGVGLALGGATLAGVAGAAAAAALSTRLGRAGPLAGGIVLVTSARCMVVYSTTPAAFIASQLAWGVGLLFLLPYILGTAAVLDRLGRWSAAAAAALSIGLAVGPGVAGFLVATFGYGALGLFMGTTGLAALLIIVPVALVVERERLGDIRASEPENEASEETVDRFRGGSVL